MSYRGRGESEEPDTISSIGVKIAKHEIHGSQQNLESSPAAMFQTDCLALVLFCVRYVSPFDTG